MITAVYDLDLGLVTVSWNEEIYSVTVIVHDVDCVTVMCRLLPLSLACYHSQISPLHVSIRNTDLSYR